MKSLLPFLVAILLSLGALPEGTPLFPVHSGHAEAAVSGHHGGADKTLTHCLSMTGLACSSAGTCVFGGILTGPAGVVERSAEGQSLTSVVPLLRAYSPEQDPPIPKA